MGPVIPILQVVGVALSAKAAYDGIKEGNFFQAVIGAVGAYYGISSLASTATAAGSSTVAATAEGAAQGASTAGAQGAEKLAATAASRGLETGAATEALKVGADNLTREAAKNAALEGLKVSGQNLTREAAKNAAFEGLKVSGEQLAPRAGMEPAKTGLDAFGDAVSDRAGKGAKWIDEKVFEPGREMFGGQGKYAADGTLLPAKEGGGLLSRGMNWMEKNPNQALFLGQTGSGLLQGKAEEEMMKEQMKYLDEARRRRSTPASVSKASSIQWDANNRRFVIQGA